MEKLKVGDQVVNIIVTNSGKSVYKFDTVESLTKTQAKLKSGRKLVNEPFPKYGKENIAQYKELGANYEIWELSTPEIIHDYEKQLKKNEINHWFMTRQFTDAEKQIIYEKFKELGILKKE